MFRNISFSTVLVVVVPFVAALMLTPPSAEAQTKPMKITGEGIASEGVPVIPDDPRPHGIIGNATHLGLHDGEGKVEIGSADLNTLTGTFGSAEPFVFRAANGDKLVCDYGRSPDGDFTGEFALTPVDDGFLFEALFIADFVPRPEACTGRFSGVTGSWTMYAWTEPFLPGDDTPVYYQWEGAGELNFRRGGRKK